MSLSSALDTAKSSLAAAQTQTSIISRNIANVNTVGATRKYATVATGAQGQVQITSITQSSNSVLFRNLLEANSAVGKGNVISNGLDRISETLGDTELARSPAALVARLGDALNTLAASPNNYELARSAATVAGDLVTSLNEASLTVQAIRRDADNELVLAAADINKILATIEDLNRRVVDGTRAGADTTDLNDQRDQAVVALSEYIGVTSQIRGENDLVLYTDSGVTLFETKARAVEYSATPGLNETIIQGNAFRIDGTAVTGDLAYMPLRSGSVAGLVALRDDVLVTYQTQIDEIARGLVAAFAESDPSGTAADRTGLFASTAVPPALTLSGSVDLTAIASGDTLSFDLEYGNQIYRASYVFTSAPATANDYRAAVQAAIDAAVPASGVGTLGGGRVAATVAGSTLTLAALGAGAYSAFGISGVSEGGLGNSRKLPSIVGLANTLRLGDGVTADPTKLRDGVSYDYNVPNSGGFTTRLNQLSDALAASRAFSATSGADSSAGIADFAASSVSWLQASRQESLSQTEYKTTLLERTRETLSNATGINMDEQLTRLIEIERSYQASSKLISTIDEMLQTLINSI